MTSGFQVKRPNNSATVPSLMESRSQHTRLFNSPSPSLFLFLFSLSFFILSHKEKDQLLRVFVSSNQNNPNKVVELNEMVVRRSSNKQQF